MVKVNLLECRRDTILNVDEAINSIEKTYGIMVNYPTQIQLDNEYVFIHYLGKRIAIPYFKKVAGNLLNNEELKINPLGDRIYDSFKCRSLSSDEIFEVIVNSFNQEFYVEIQ